MASNDERDAGGTGIQVIARAAALLRALRGNPNGLTLSQLAQDVGLPRSTVQRIAGALITEGLLAPATLSGGVVLGPALIALAGDVQTGIVEIARPYLRELRDATGETVDLAEFRQTHLLFIDQHLGDHRLCAISGVDRLFPLHNTANGKACLALLPVAEARRCAAASLGTQDSATLDVLMEELRDVRKTGMAYDREQNAIGISAVGFAFRHSTGRIYAIAVPTPAERFATSQDQISRRLLETKMKIVAAIGDVERGHRSS